MVAEYITGIKAAWELAKGLKLATDSIEDANLKLQMAELISALADAKIEAADNAEKIADLERQLNARVTLKYMDEKYYKEENGELDGPYCTTCFDSTSKQIRLKPIPGATRGNWKCLVCKSYYR
ncbi:hypothetical protein KW517_02595 [Vibrio fluvialis]|nr:hypothetical protein [Vibrio fluvialis]